MAKKDSKYAPQALLTEILTKSPEARVSEIREEVRKRGYDNVLSSALTNVRRKLGLIKGGPGKAVSLEDVEVAADLPSALGITVKETLETCQNVQHIALKLGGLTRLIEALSALQKFTKLG